MSLLEAKAWTTALTVRSLCFQISRNFGHALCFAFFVSEWAGVASFFLFGLVFYLSRQHPQQNPHETTSQGPALVYTNQLGGCNFEYLTPSGKRQVAIEVHEVPAIPFTGS